MLRSLVGSEMCIRDRAQVDYNADTSDYLAQVELVNRSIIKLNEQLALDLSLIHI